MKIYDIQNSIIDLLVEEDAVDLPRICEQYGMEYGTVKEATKSKYKYVENRLERETHINILDIGERVATDYNSIGIGKKIEEYRDDSNYKIKFKTRNMILKELYKIEIEGKLRITDFLKRIWRIDEIEGIYGTETLEENIVQHMIRNDDWDYEYLFERVLDLKGEDDKIFMKFLDELVHFRVRAESESKEIIEVINKCTIQDGYIIRQHGEKLGVPCFKIMRKVDDGVEGAAKNLIFSADGPKPEIVIDDAINNNIRIVANKECCLVYDRAINENGLRWKDIVQWWKNSTHHDKRNKKIDKELYVRLRKALDSKPERDFFCCYYKLFKDKYGDRLPALIPQVYLHYDPKTLKELGNKKRLERQRMDFLMLLSSRHRVVIEIDGKQHYSDKEIASPKLYSDMVSEDRRLKLEGYEVYRFGGHELTQGNIEDIEEIVRTFFIKLFEKYNIN